MGISQAYYSKLESGYSHLSREMIDRAIGALGIEKLHPLFISKLDVLESLEQQQLEFMNIQKKIILLENQIKELEKEVAAMRNQIKSKRK